MKRNGWRNWRLCRAVRLKLVKLARLLEQLDRRDEELRIKDPDLWAQLHQERSIW